MSRLLTGFFLLGEMILYVLILTTGGKLLVYSSFFAIVLCFLYALSGIKTGHPLLIIGLLFTVLADFCLVVCVPIEQLWGMVFFLVTQTCYALFLNQALPNRNFQLLRMALVLSGIVLCFLVLRDKTDLLALISVCYYVNLILNALHAFCQRKQNKLFPAALVLFILCDTVVGLQVASNRYLPIQEGSLLHRILFVGFNLSWLFYLPSQVLIALSAHRNH